MTEHSKRLWALDEKKRARLLDPAAAEFIEHGYEGASLNRILANAKMSKGQAYYYITGKSDLYLAVCTQHFSGLLNSARTQAEQLNGAKDFWIAVEALAGSLAQELLGNTKLSALALTVYDSAASVESIAPLAVHLDEIIDGIIRTGQDAGQIRTDIPDELVRNMLKSLARSIDRWFAQNSTSLPPHDIAEVSRITFEMIRNFVRPAPNGDDLAG